MDAQNQAKRKKSHDVAYLIVLLLIILGVFLFAIMFVNSHLPSYQFR